MYSRLEYLLNYTANHEEAHLLCSAFGMFGSQMKGHQSLVRPLPSADIAEHRVSYTSALLGLCLQSKPQRGRRAEGETREGPLGSLKRV